ncbi:vitamin B12-dependent ribonucleotide reductase, partial [Streptomyces chlorus]
EHYEVFDCAMGERSISAMGHVRMMAAIQPWISGALSKTVNLPESATVEDVEEVYFEAWKMGVKALAIYRDNCKVGQPLSAKTKEKGKTEITEKTEDTIRAAVEKVVEYRPVRKRLPKGRPGITTSFTVGGAEGYMTANSYPDDGLGEVFLKMSKQGSTLAGMMDAFSIAVSVGLQYGVPLETYVSKFTNMRFEPAGMTDDPDVRMAQSIVDYIFRRLALDFLPFETRSALGIHSADERQRHLETGSYEPTDDELDVEGLAQSAPRAQELKAVAMPKAEVEAEAAKPAPQQAHTSAELVEMQLGIQADAPLCFSCGTKMQRAGSCYICEGCGSTSGCS